jgi:hypothetical protein
MPAPASWLHNMSVAPRTTVTAAREPLDGVRFALAADGRWACPGRRLARDALAPRRDESPLTWALRLGLAGLAALVTLDDVSPRGARWWIQEDINRLPVRSGSAPEGAAIDVAAAVERARQHRDITADAFRGLCDARLQALGVPARSGIFVTDAPQAADRHIGFGGTLAALSRRSGPLYLPRRAPQVGLIVPFAGTLHFPEA